MPLALPPSLHSFTRLRLQESLEIIDVSDASTIDLPSLHIGFLNMMPDAAIEATERQFFRLLCAGSPNYVVVVHPFTIKGIERNEAAAEYVYKSYQSFSDIKGKNLDALLLSGANPKRSELSDEPFWDHLVNVFDWATCNVKSILCSCLATHAVIQHVHGINRVKCANGKRWGNFEHKVTRPDSPLVEGIHSNFLAVHSHVFEMTESQLHGTGIEVLATSDDADFHIAISADKRWVFLQGHPEYDAISLLKEYKREIELFIEGGRDDYPPYPNNYLSSDAEFLLNQFQTNLKTALDNGSQLPVFPEAQIALNLGGVDNHGIALFSNWIRMVSNTTG